jgi:hypothetical protein
MIHLTLLKIFRNPFDPLKLTSSRSVPFSGLKLSAESFSIISGSFIYRIIGSRLWIMGMDKLQLTGL